MDYTRAAIIEAGSSDSRNGQVNQSTSGAGRASATTRPNQTVAELAREERIIDEVTVHLKPYYSMNIINFIDYKKIMKRAVTQIMRLRSGEIHCSKIARLVREYVKAYRDARRRWKATRQRAMTERPQYYGWEDSSSSSTEDEELVSQGPMTADKQPSPGDSDTTKTNFRQRCVKIEALFKQADSAVDTLKSLRCVDLTGKLASCADTFEQGSSLATAVATGPEQVLGAVGKLSAHITCATCLKEKPATSLL